MRPTIYTVSRPGPGAVSTMAKPRPGDWLDDEMTGLRAAGVDILVCLLATSELRELDLTEEPHAAARAGLDFIWIPVLDRSVPDTATVLPLVADLAHRVRHDRHIVCHCRAGLGRSSLLAAAVLLHLGHDPDDAWAMIWTARCFRVLDTDEQRSWISRLHDHTTWRIAGAARHAWTPLRQRLGMQEGGGQVSETEAGQAARLGRHTTVAERGSMRYTCHGGGPCDGALNGAVMPEPLSSGSAGQPLSAHAFAMRATAPGSVTRAASPSMTTSASRIDTATEQRGSRAMLRPFRVPAPVWNQNVPSSQRAPTAVTCGLPSSLTVHSHVVRELRRPEPATTPLRASRRRRPSPPAAARPPHPG